jgi:hypothetical protein
MRTHSRVYSQHDEHKEEEKGPEIGSGKRSHCLGINFEYETRADVDNFLDGPALSERHRAQKSEDDEASEDGSETIHQ